MSRPLRSVKAAMADDRKQVLRILNRVEAHPDHWTAEERAKLTDALRTALRLLLKDGEAA